MSLSHYWTIPVMLNTVLGLMLALEDTPVAEPMASLKPSLRCPNGSRRWKGLLRKPEVASCARGAAETCETHLLQRVEYLGDST